MERFDVVVIGGGSAGFAAASRARDLGAAVALIERDRLGGDCPNRACVPTKALLRSADVLALIRRAGEFGLSAKDVSFDWRAVVARKDAIVSRLTGERLLGILDRRGIAFFAGQARFKSPNDIEINGRTLSADRFILATGSVQGIPPISGLRETGFITYVEAIGLPALPKSLVIIGAGPVGVEFAQIFIRFGVDVTLVEMAPAVLGHEDKEVSEAAQGYLRDQGIKIRTGVKVSRVGAANGQKLVTLQQQGREQTLLAEEIMVTTGRGPALAELNLSAAGVEYDRHGITVNEELRTTASNIWAAGDITGKALYTHVATYEGDVAGYNCMAETPEKIDYRVIPRVTFCDPEVASVGMTESQAKAAGYPVSVGRFPLRYLGKSLVMGEDRGFVKLVANTKDDQILGGHIIGPQSGELLHEVVVAMQGRLPAQTIAETMHAYPTLSEGVGGAAADLVEAEPGEVEKRVAS